MDYYLRYWKTYATELIGLWLDLENAYETRRSRYLEYVWYVIKRAWERGLLYEGYRVLPFCPRCETALSDAEVDMGYEERESPSIYVKLEVAGRPGEYLLIWTTTPWTLIDNEAVAVHPNAEYCTLEVGGERWYVAEYLVERVAEELELRSWRCAETLPGASLEGTRYVHPLLEEVPIHKDHQGAHYVVTAEFVSLEEGTGIVHIAPGHGPEDFEVGTRYGLPITSTVEVDGVFNESSRAFAGLYVEDASRVVIEVLKSKGLLVKSGTVVHRYPHCWRCGTPLIYRADRQWFIAMSRLREDLLRALESVEVYPEEHKNRFRSWLANVKDWTISRSRVWGTPLPVWRCVDDPQKILVVGSLEELRRYAVKLPDVDDDKLVHRPWIDSAELRTEDCSRWVREPFVVDVWIDSGVAWIASIDGLRNVKLFEVLYPYTFITEAVDQTRGWFYSLLATSVIDRGTAPYRQIMVQGHVLDKFGRKMSKHLGNVVYAEEAIRRFGVDPLRLYLLSRYPPGESFMFDPEEIRKTTMGVLNILWNVFRFAYMYMSLDGFSPKVHRLEKYLSRLLPEDRWVLSRVNSVSEEFENFMFRYEIHKALQRVIEFTVEELSRTYLKLVRPRVWSEEGDDRFVVYSVLYYVLKRLLKMLAPAVPYVSEALWLRFFKVFEPEEFESVHLARLDPVDRVLIDREIEERFSLALSSVEALASLRNRLGIKIRWPLAEAVVASTQVTDKLGPLVSVIARLANVKTVTLSTDLGVCSERGYEVQEGRGVIVCLPKSIDRELFREAIDREVIRRVQVMRKEAGLSISDYIEVAVESDSDEVLDSIRALENYIMSEVRASKMFLGAPSSDMYVKTWDIEGLSVRIGIRRSVSP